MLRLSRSLFGVKRFGVLYTGQHQQIRLRSGLPINTVILFVPQQEAWIVERFGKFHKLLEPGLNFLVPIIDSIRYVQSLKEIAIDIPQQSAITLDNVTLQIDGVLYLRVVNPYRASYGVEDAEYAITQLAQTTMRSELGKIALDTVFREREMLNAAIVESINKAAESWGVDCKRYEIRDMRLPARVQEAMQMQVEAERKKRAAVLESEGVREADINVAQGKKQARILTSEAYKLEKINQAVGEAEAILATANAKSQAIQLIAEALAKHNGFNAASVSIAEQYINAFGNVAKEGNTILLPTDTGNISSMVTQAMTIFKRLSEHKKPSSFHLSSSVDPDTTGSTDSISTELASKLEKDLQKKNHAERESYYEESTSIPSGSQKPRQT